MNGVNLHIRNILNVVITFAVRASRISNRRKNIKLIEIFIYQVLSSFLRFCMLSYQSGAIWFALNNTWSNRVPLVNLGNSRDFFLNHFNFKSGLSFFSKNDCVSSHSGCQVLRNIFRMCCFELRENALFLFTLNLA